MAIQYSVALRNAELDTLEDPLPGYSVGALLRMYSGSAPASTDTAATGTLLVDMTLPTDWMAAASGGTKQKLGTWSATAAASGNAGYFRICKPGGDQPCIIQGTIGTSSADLIMDSVSLSAGQTVSLSTFTITAGQA